MQMFVFLQPFVNGTVKLDSFSCTASSAKVTKPEINNGFLGKRPRKDLGVMLSNNEQKSLC